MPSMRKATQPAWCRRGCALLRDRQVLTSARPSWGRAEVRAAWSADRQQHAGRPLVGPTWLVQPEAGRFRSGTGSAKRARRWTGCGPRPLTRRTRDPNVVSRSTGRDVLPIVTGPCRAADRDVRVADWAHPAG